MTDEELFAHLDSLGIKHSTTEHPALRTVEEGRDWHHKIPGMHGKNLFMKDKKDRLWLIVMPGDKRARLGALEKSIGSSRLSFGKPELLMAVMGIAPGSVTPFALLNDKDRQITVVLDQDLMKASLVNFHPMRNTASTSLRPQDLLLFINGLGYAPVIADCGIWPDQNCGNESN